MRLVVILIAALIILGVLISSLIIVYHESVTSKVFTTSSLRAFPRIGECSNVTIYVLVDNHGYDDFLSPWGISLLIRVQDSLILFDAGPNPEALEVNSRLLGINLSNLKFVVISHEHGDHWGGLRYVARVAPHTTVYVPAGMSSSVKNAIANLGFKVIEVHNTTVVSGCVAIIGELLGPPWEQALAVNVKGLGLIVLVGCSHPGVDRIVAKAVKDLGIKPYTVIGGFHLMGASRDEVEYVVKNLIKLGIRRVYPIHCSGDLIRELMKSEYPEIYGDGHVGLVLVFNVVEP